jgi:glycosyltransferase involved in cell wall biosynthesis
VHSLHYGGAELLARRFAVGLQSEFRPVFACLDALGPLGEEVREAGVPVCVLRRRPGFDLRCAWRLSRWLRRQKVDLVHAHQYAPFFYSSLARWTARGIPVLFTEHGRDFPDFRRWKRVLANRFLLRRNDHVVAVGQHVRQALIDNEGLPPDRIDVIYNGVDPKPFELPPSERNAMRTKLGYSDKDFVIIQVARLNRLKDHATAIRAVAQLIESHRNARLLLVGDGEEREALEALVDSLGLRAAVHFLGSRSDVPRLLQAADLFLLTSISEGIPLTLVEAMLARVPIVAPRVGGVPEVLGDGKCGLLTAPGDPASFADCIRRIMDDATVGLRMVRLGQRQAHELFSDDAMLTGYRAAYRSIVSQSTGEIPCTTGVDGSRDSDPVPATNSMASHRN